MPTEEATQTVPVRALIEKTVLGALPPEALDALCAAAMVRRYRRSTSLLGAGHAARHVWLVVEGRIDMFYRQADGHESLVGAFGPGHWCVWVAIFTPKPLNQDLTAAAGSTLISVPAAVVRRVFAHHPAIYPKLIGEIGTRMQLLLQWVGQSALGSSTQRLAGLLHGLAQLESPLDAPCCIQASQTRLAHALGVHRESVSKGLEALEGLGLLRRAYSRIEILDIDGLQEFSREPLKADVKAVVKRRKP
jgi:CRP-like cAMP-binding protein